MRKLRGYIPPMAMSAFLLVGAVYANDGIIIHDSASLQSDTCTVQRDGIIIHDTASFVGDPFTAAIADVATGIFIGDYADPGCLDTAMAPGIMVSD